MRLFLAFSLMLVFCQESHQKSSGRDPDFTQTANFEEIAKEEEGQPSLPSGEKNQDNKTDDIVDNSDDHLQKQAENNPIDQPEVIVMPDSPPQAKPRLLYIATGSTNLVAVARLEIDGKITRLAAMDLNLSGNTGAMAYAPLSRKLFVGVNEQIATVNLGSGGELSLQGITPQTGRPVYLAVNDGETRLVSAYFSTDRMRVHDIVAAAPHQQLAMLAVENEPHAALITATNKIYVPHRNGGVIQWYSLNNGNGMLSFQGEVTADNGAGPRHISLSDDQKLAFVANEYSDSITSYQVNSNQLIAQQTLSTLPQNFNGNNNTCADIHLSKDNKAVYVSNRGHDSIAVFSVATDGSLALIEITPTEPRPREFSITPDGKFLIVAGQESGFIQSYVIGVDYKLTQIDQGRIEVGGAPAWIIIEE